MNGHPKPRAVSGKGDGTGWRVPVAAVVRAARAVGWYVDSVLGGQDYQRYLAHMRRAHPGRAVVDERTYWRERYAEQDRNPATRCC